MYHTRTHLGAIVAEVGLILLGVAMPLASGGVHTPALISATSISALVVIALWIYRRSRRDMLELSWYGALLLGVAGYTFFQALPLPLALLDAIAPETVRILNLTTPLSPHPLDWHPISLDPPATLWESLKISACALTFIAGHNYLWHEERRKRVILAISLCGMFIAAVGLFGAIAFPGKPFIFYTKSSAHGTGLISSSFINSNHGAAFLTVCTLLTIGLAMEAIKPQMRILLFVGATLLGAGVLLTLSRGGIVALAVGLGCYGILVLRRWRSKKRRRWSELLPLPLAVIVLLGAWVAYEPIVKELSELRANEAMFLNKVALWDPGMTMALTNRWVGVGRGAFLTAFPRYRSNHLSPDITYTHLENQYLHLPIEWGIPVGFGIIVSSAIAMIIWMRANRHYPHLMAASAALIALACHALVDFNLEVLGVAIPVALLAGSLSAATRRNVVFDQRHAMLPELRSMVPHPKEVRRDPVGGMLIAVAAGLLVLCAWVAITQPDNADKDIEEINGLITAGAQPQKVLEAVTIAAHRHPTDHMPHLLAGRYLAALGNPDALNWLNRAILLNPTDYRAHLEIARLLQRKHRIYQSLVEYKQAILNGADKENVLREAIPLVRNRADVSALIPKEIVSYKIAVEIFLSQKRLEFAEHLVEEGTRLWSNTLELLIATAQLQIANQRHADALATIRTIVKRSATPATYLLWVQAARSSSDTDEELRILIEARKRFPSDSLFSFELAETYLRLGRLAEAQSTTETLLQSLADRRKLSKAHALLARIFRQQGKHHQAGWEDSRAKQLMFGP